MGLNNRPPVNAAVVNGYRTPPVIMQCDNDVMMTCDNDMMMTCDNGVMMACDNDV